MHTVRNISVFAKKSPTRKAMGVDYMRSVFNVDADTIFKAQNPFESHPYVYAAAQAIATNLAQVPLEVFQERDETTVQRRQIALKRGEKNWTPRCGSRRMMNITKRYLRQARRFKGRRIMGLEVDPDHEINLLLDKPNPIMTGTQLIEAISVFMSLRGECFILMIKQSGEPISPGETPEELWMLNPDNIKEKTDRATGKLLGWEWTGKNEGLGQRRELLMPWEVMHFKYFNPGNPLRGYPPLSSAVMPIVQDVLADQHNKSALENGAEPGGYLEYEGELDDEEREAFRQAWHDRHGGPRNRRKIAILENGFKYYPSGMDMQEMQFMEQKGWNREALLAVLGVPKSVLAVTEDLNYATQLAQDRNFWNKKLIPLARHIEQVLNMVLMFNEPDTVVVAFDLSGIEALQEDIKEKVTTAKELTNPDGLRVPPMQALDMVGIEVDEYLGGDISLVRPFMMTMEDFLSDEEDEEFEEVETEPETSEVVETKTPTRGIKIQNVPKTSTFCQRRGMAMSVYARRTRMRKAASAESWAALIGDQERSFKGQFKTHVIGLRRETLRNFDNAARSKTFSDEEIDRILFDLEEAHTGIKRRSAPLYERMIEAVYDFTELELGGVFVFDVDDPDVLKFMQTKVNKITGANNRLRKALTQTLRDGVTNSESLVELRQRITRAFNRSVAPSRTLTIARTESAQMMSGTRQILFKKEGVTKHEWVTAGDEHVRDHHKVFGRSGEQEVGFNFMTLVSGDGKLLYPSDVQGPAAEVINCRCVAIATG